MEDKTTVEKEVRVRSAPSPTGRPHIGTAYNALFNYVFARKHNGSFILRIEDTDRSRYDAESEKEILEALKWLGLKPDESPEVGGEFAPYRQSERLALYQKYAEQLVEQKDAYYCFCSEERLQENRERCREEGRPPMYDSHCRELDPREARRRAEEGEDYVIRLKVPREGVTQFHDLVRGDIEIENCNIDDQVLLKSDGFPTYHLANVVDDHLMDITHIIRGEEWLSSVPKHVLLYHVFGWEIPIYAHTPLLRGKDKSKLGKRQRSLPVLEYREQGYLAEALLNYLALLGWTHPEEKEFFDLKEMIGKFELEDIDSTAPVFDPEKLRWLNGKWIRKLNVAELISKLKILNLKFLQSMSEDRLEDIVSLVQERMENLRDFEQLTNFFFQEPEIDKELLVEQAHGDEKEAKEILETTSQIIEKKELEHDILEQAFRSKAKEEGWGMRAICMTTRVAITGRTVSPPLFNCIAILGPEETIARLGSARNLL